MSDEPMSDEEQKAYAAELSAMARNTIEQMSADMRGAMEPLVKTAEQAMQATILAVDMAERERERADAAENKLLHEPTGDEIIKEYYREKRRNKRLTLRAYLQKIGIPEREGYIRKRKVAYDRRTRRK